MPRSRIQATAGTPRTLALVVLVTPGFRPHGEIGNGDACAGRARWADNVNGTASSAVAASTFPVVEF